MSSWQSLRKMIRTDRTRLFYKPTQPNCFISTNNIILNRQKDRTESNMVYQNDKIYAYAIDSTAWLKLERLWHGLSTLDPQPLSHFQLFNTHIYSSVFDRETVQNERTFGFRSGFKQRRLINGRMSVSSVTRKGNV